MRRVARLMGEASADTTRRSRSTDLDIKHRGVAFKPDRIDTVSRIRLI